MQYRTLTKSGIKLSEVTFGCWEMGGDFWEFASEKENIRAVHKALEIGLNTFDTAEIYGCGRSEELLGKALCDRRSEAIISTKVFPYKNRDMLEDNLSPGDIRNAAEKSLKRLKTDYIDIYFIHFPNKNIPIEESLSEVARLKQEGKIRAVGLSRFSLEQLNDIIRYMDIDILQYEYSLLERSVEWDILPFCMENSIGMMAYGSIARGILTGKFHFGQLALDSNDTRNKDVFFLKENMEIEKELLLLLKDLSGKYQCSISQLALCWLLARKGVTTGITGTQNEKHIAENAKAADIIIDRADLNLIGEISMKVFKQIGPTTLYEKAASQLFEN